MSLQISNDHFEAFAQRSIHALCTVLWPQKLHNYSNVSCRIGRSTVGAFEFAETLKLLLNPVKPMAGMQ